MSTLQVDKITPYQSASIQIDGNVVQADAATTGSNTFVGAQNILGEVTASIINMRSGTYGNGIRFYQDGTTSLRFYSGSNETEVGTWVNMQVNPANGALALTSWPSDDMFASFEPFLSQSQFGYPVRFVGGITEATSFDSNISIGGIVNSNAGLNVTNGNITASTGSIQLSNGNIQLTGSFTLSGSFGPNIVSAPGESSQTDFFQFGGFTGNNSVVYPTAFIGLQNDSGSGINHAFTTAYASNDYNYFSSMGVNENGFKYFLGDGNYDYDFSYFKLEDNGDQTATFTVHADTAVIDSVLQLKDWAGSLPTGASGQLAVSNNNLYYHNGTSWTQIN